MLDLFSNIVREEQKLGKYCKLKNTDFLQIILRNLLRFGIPAGYNPLEGRIFPEFLKIYIYIMGFYDHMLEIWFFGIFVLKLGIQCVIVKFRVFQRKLGPN